MSQPKPILSIIQKFILAIILIVISGNIGYRMGQKNLSLSDLQIKKVLVKSSPPPNQNVDFTLFWSVWDKLEQKYLDKTKFDPQKMVYGAIQGMVASLGDPYTLFLPPKENNDFKTDLAGSFEGIGAQLGIKDEKIVVISPLKGHPAEKAGIKSGDFIVKVNDEETIGWTVPQAVTKIRGAKGTTVKLSIARESLALPFEVNVTRDTIIVKSVEYETKNLQSDCKTDCAKVGYLKLSRFGDQTNDEWNKAVTLAKKDLPDANFRGVILDLRNNPGGYFQSSIYVASEFIKSGIVVIQENSDSTKETFSVNRLGSLLNTKLVVLINQGSASAAEIVAGALRDNNRGQLVGEKTFGKGSVQTPEDLPDGSGLHITTARWIMPKGEWINGTGIKPDIEIKDATDSADLQLNKALELFN